MPHTDPRTREFLEPYLTPHGIGAMLDVPLRQNNATIGVLCAEHVGGPRTWTVDEQNFAISHRQPDRGGGGRRRAARRRSTSLAESEARARLDRRHGARRVHRHRFGRPDRRLERAGGGDVRLDARGGRSAGTLADTIIPPASARRTRAACARFHETGEAPVVNQRLELRGAAPRRARVPDRDHDHLADARRTTATSSARSSRHLRAPRARRRSCGAPRSRPRPRRARRASSWPT